MRNETNARNADCDELNRLFGAPGRIVFRPSESGVPVVALANQYGSCQIQLFGAQILSYLPTGHMPVLFKPADFNFDKGNVNVHGGIPVCWPWFGRCGEPGSRGHGFARIACWSVRSTTYDEDQTVITLGLKSSDKTREFWPHDFDLEYKIQISMKLTLTLKTVNTGKETFRVTEGFHPYFRVRNRDDVTVRGLDGCEYCDARKSDVADATWVGDLAMNEARDHVFTVEKHEYAILDPGLHRAIAIVSRGNSKVVVWNPGAEAADSLVGLGAEDWRNFVCVEPATLFAVDGYDLEPGEEHVLQTAIQAVSDDGSARSGQ